MARQDWVALSGGAANQVIGPEALRCPELHDFGDLHGSGRRIKTPVMIVLALMGLLTASHFAYQSLNAVAAPFAEQQARSAAG